MSLERVETTHQLGRFLVRTGEHDEGLRRLREAVALLERPDTTVPPSASAETRRQFADRARRYYAEPAVILATKGDAAEAFSLVDRMHERVARADCASCPAIPASPLDAVAKLPPLLIIEFFVHARRVRTSPVRVIHLLAESERVA